MLALLQKCRNLLALKTRCTPCAYAYCLNCRSHGQACKHNIDNYSSELRAQFIFDSIGSSKSSFDIGELIDNEIGQTAYFGSSRQEQSENRQEALEEIFQRLSRGSKVGNTYFQSFMQHGVQNVPFADFVYQPAEYQNFKNILSTKLAHYKFGVLNLCWIVRSKT